MFCAVESENESISNSALREHIRSFLDSLDAPEDVLILPPDYTRFHSHAGKITEIVCEYLREERDDDEPPPTKRSKKDRQIQIMPALGTHAPMTSTEIQKMFGKASSEEFLVHDWRNDVVTIGHAPEEMVAKATDGQVREPWPAQLNKKIWEKKGSESSLVLSIGQVVPHEVYVAVYLENARRQLTLIAVWVWQTSTRTSLSGLEGSKQSTCHILLVQCMVWSA